MAELKTTALYQDANLQGYWRMEGDWTDESGNGYTLTPTNSPTFVSGKYGQAGDFEASSSQYSVRTDPTNLEITSDITMCAWITPETVTAAQTILGKNNSANTAYRMIYLSGGDKPAIIISGLTTNISVISTGTISAATRYFVIGRYNSTTQKLNIRHYNDSGTLIENKEVTASGSASDMSTIDFAIGRGGEFDGEYFDGIVDDAAVFNRFLTDEEADNLAASAGTTTSTSTSTSTTTTSTSTSTSTSTTTTSTSTSTTSTSTSTSSSTSSSTSTTTTSTTTTWLYPFEVVQKVIQL